MPETLFLTTNLIDRFLEIKGVTRKNLQLVRSATFAHILNLLHSLVLCDFAIAPQHCAFTHRTRALGGTSVAHAHSCRSCVSVKHNTFNGALFLPQQVGVTAMLIASKYEEIWAPELNDFVYISDRAYKKEQILTMEKVMLNALKFNLTGVRRS